LPSWLRPDADLNERARIWIERKILCSLAGIAAERKANGRHNWRGADGDLSSAVRLADYLFDNNEVVEKYLAYMLSLAKATIGKKLCWLQIEALAAALLVHGTLSEQAAREVCGGALLKAIPRPPALQVPKVSDRPLLSLVDEPRRLDVPSIRRAWWSH
jgi:hypothetical protein